MDTEKKEFGRWWVWVTFLILVTMMIFGIARALGLIGTTVIERKVFEQSFQYSEARKTEMATFQAQLAEIERRLATSPDPHIREGLEAQAAALRVQISVSRSKSQ